MAPVDRAGKWLVGLAAIGGLIARLVVMQKRAHQNALDWQKIAQGYRWKLDEHGKSWCTFKPSDIAQSGRAENMTTERITIDLPTPPHTVSDRGLTYLDNYEDTHDRSHAERAMVSIDGLGDAVPVAEAEEFALAILWLVRNHYHGEGLRSEVRDG